MLASPADLLTDTSNLLANAGAAVEVGPGLYAQLAVAGGMLATGFGLESFTEVEEVGCAEPPKAEGEEDIYRDSLLRYCGYANEVGEAFRPLVPVEIVYFSYVIAITYILADTVDKGKKGSEVGGAITGVLGATDTFCWQMLASVLFPSYIINRTVLLLVSLGAEGSLPDLLSVRASAPSTHTRTLSPFYFYFSHHSVFCRSYRPLAGWLDSDRGRPHPHPSDHPAARHPRALYDELVLPPHRQQHPRRRSVRARPVDMVCVRLHTVVRSSVVVHGYF